MASSTQQTQQVLEAMDWRFGVRQCRSITLVDDVAGSLEDEYWDVNEIDENYVANDFYIWLNGGTGTDPSISGKTGIQVTYTNNDTKETIAGLLVTALAAADVNIISNVAGVVTYENKFLGPVTLEDATNAPSLTLTNLALGSGGLIGAVASGGASVSSSQSLENIVSDQTGDIVLDQIMKGAEISLEMTVAEMTTANWESLVGDGSGDTLELSSNLTGYGTSKLYNSSFSNAGQLVGHPIRLALSDRSADVVIWKTMPVLNSINYSGAEVQGGEFSFSALRDASKDEKISLFARGDHSLL